MFKVCKKIVHAHNNLKFYVEFHLLNIAILCNVLNASRSMHLLLVSSMHDHKYLSQNFGQLQTTITYPFANIAT